MFFLKEEGADAYAYRPCDYQHLVAGFVEDDHPNLLGVGEVVRNRVAQIWTVSSPSVDDEQMFAVVLRASAEAEVQICSATDRDTVERSVERFEVAIRDDVKIHPALIDRQIDPAIIVDAFPSARLILVFQSRIRTCTEEGAHVER